MKFSVLMSVYSKENASFFEDAIKSILDQTLLPNEIVIVRDGPLTNKLDNVINRYSASSKLFKVITLQKNSGLGVALNIGIKNCNYDVIARMDTDDFCLPNRFETQISYLINHPEIDVIGSSVIEYDDLLQNKLSVRTVPEDNASIKQYIKKRNPFNHMSVIYKKSVVLAAGSYEDCPYFEDYYLWCKIHAKNGTFYNIQEPLLNVRGGNSMIIRRGGRKYIKYIINFQKKIYKLDITNYIQFVINLIIRTLVSIIPSNIRGFFYKKLLRSQYD